MLVLAHRVLQFSSSLYLSTALRASSWDVQSAGSTTPQNSSSFQFHRLCRSGETLLEIAFVRFQLHVCPETFFVLESVIFERNNFYLFLIQICKKSHTISEKWHWSIATSFRGSGRAQSCSLRPSYRTRWLRYLGLRRFEWEICEDLGPNTFTWFKDSSIQWDFWVLRVHHQLFFKRRVN